MRALRQAQGERENSIESRRHPEGLRIRERTSKGEDAAVAASQCRAVAAQWQRAAAGLRDHRVAKFFIRWQRVSMPAYRPFLTDTQLAALMSYVRWVNRGEWQQKPLDLAH